MIVNEYDAIAVELLQMTQAPEYVIGASLAITQDTNPESTKEINEVSPKTFAYLVRAGHGSVLEHVNFHFVIERISRALLAQLTRHRMGSFTAASQHYNDYRAWPFSMPAIPEDKPEARNIVLNILQEIEGAYTSLVDKHGVSVHEARMVLPQAAQCALYWTINLRSLINFLQQRLCHRNVPEMQIFACKVLVEVQREMPFMTLDVIGPSCVSSGRCTQGKMACKYGKYDPANIDDYYAKTA